MALAETFPVSLLTVLSELRDGNVLVEVGGAVPARKAEHEQLWSVVPAPSSWHRTIGTAHVEWPFTTVRQAPRRVDLAVVSKWAV